MSNRRVPIHFQNSLGFPFFIIFLQYLQLKCYRNVQTCTRNVLAK